jgi:hypothetical protein
MRKPKPDTVRWLDGAGDPRPVVFGLGLVIGAALGAALLAVCCAWWVGHLVGKAREYDRLEGRFVEQLTRAEECESSSMTVWETLSGEQP